MNAARDEAGRPLSERTLSPWRLAIASQTVEIAFTSAGQQQLGWHWVWTRVERGSHSGARTAPTDRPQTDPLRERTSPPHARVAASASEASSLPPHPILAAGAVQTHPVLAGLAWGPALASLARARGPEAWTQPAISAACSRAVAVLAPVVASVGDRIFHFAVPLCLSAGLVVLGLHFSPWSVFWYPILCALFILAASVWSWEIGIRGEEAVADLLATRKLERYAQALEAAGRLLLGGVFGWLLASVRSEEGGGTLLGSAVLFAIAGMVAWRRGLSPRARLGLLLVPGALASRWFG